MKKIYIVLLVLTLIFSSCATLKNPFARRSSIEIKEGYLSLKKINENLDKQMPLIQKVGSNEIKIVSVTTFASKDTKSLIIETEFIFTSFEIPEGLPAIARFKSSLEYLPKTKEFRFSNISIMEINFLKEELLEYVSPQQRKFIDDTLINKLYELVLHKSKKPLKPMKSFSVKEGKIKILFK